ncbi:hypothetical protein KIW84_014526 [Lathyrus oleraceus]|uniref:Uncharacterized protein n=1 Tax=Pisum sativum TaxID=3888 RepID=A0A9D5BNA7_PEA|nr:hypothetical protein KIW84_014526 [Pisum sativum]
MPIFDESFEEVIYPKGEPDAASIKAGSSGASCYPIMWHANPSNVSTETEIQFPFVSPVRAASWVREPGIDYQDLQVPAVSPHVDCRQMSVSNSQGPAYRNKHNQRPMNNEPNKTTVMPNSIITRIESDDDADDAHLELHYVESIIVVMADDEIDAAGDGNSNSLNLNFDAAADEGSGKDFSKVSNATLGLLHILCNGITTSEHCMLSLSVGNKSPANSNNYSGSRVSVGNKSPANANPDSGSKGSKE